MATSNLLSLLKTRLQTPAGRQELQRGSEIASASNSYRSVSLSTQLHQDAAVKDYTTVTLCLKGLDDGIDPKVLADGIGPGKLAEGMTEAELHDVCYPTIDDNLEPLLGQVKNFLNLKAQTTVKHGQQ